MPTYKYKGKIPFTNLEYNLYNVKPNDVFVTNTYLPSSWVDMFLVNAQPNGIIQNSQDFTITEITDIDIQNYPMIAIVLINSDSAKVSIHIEDIHADGVELDSVVYYYQIDNKQLDYSKLVIAPLFGQPQLRVYFLNRSELVI